MTPHADESRQACRLQSPSAIKPAQTPLRLTTMTARKLEEAKSSRIENAYHPIQPDPDGVARGRSLLDVTSLNPWLRFRLSSSNEENDFVGVA